MKVILRTLCGCEKKIGTADGQWRIIVEAGPRIPLQDGLGGFQVMVRVFQYTDEKNGEFHIFLENQQATDRMNGRCEPAGRRPKGKKKSAKR